HAFRRLLDLDELDACANAAGARHRLGKADLVAPVVKARRDPFDRIDLIEESWNERQRQEAMGDRRAEGRVPRLLAIDVTPSGVARRLGKAIDHVLADAEPVALAQHLARRALQLLDIGKTAHDGPARKNAAETPIGGGGSAP